MKDWQHGYELDYLLETESFYSRYNEYSCSPFSSVKKNVVASGLYEKTLKIYKHDEKPLIMLDTKISKAKSPITMYSDIKIGIKEKGDRTITKLAWVDGRDKVVELLTAFNEPCWLYVWAEDERSNKLAVDSGFTWVGTKVTTFAELYAIYFRESSSNNVLFDEPRHHPSRLDVEDCSLEKTNLRNFDINPLVEAVRSFEFDYTNHYSNYNKKNSWGALSLRGYTDDPAFITKPAEMNKKWKLEHADEEFKMQDTELRSKLSQVEPLLKLFPSEIHRVRLMKLTPDGGELERHTDQVDPDSGVQDGKEMRFHFPLITNDDVVFTMWGVDGKPKSVNMQVGECWYLDTRKPHRAINNGNTDRIHLVVDVEADDKIRELIKNDIP